MYDVIVIGGGPGGYAAAIRCSQLGAKVALIEPDQIGGTCVNRGCIPAKIWHQATSYKQAIDKAAEFGLKAELIETDLKTVVDRKIGITSDLRQGMTGILKSNKVDIFNAYGVFKGPRAVQADDQVLEAGKIIIATGAVLNTPEIPGLDQALMTTDQIFNMTEVPESVLVFGADFIEIEMASILNLFGAKVILVFESSRILPGEDSDTGQRISKALREQGIEIIPRSSIAFVEKNANGFEAALKGTEEKKIAIDRILVAGHKPNLEALKPEQAGLVLKDDGFIKVDDYLKTSVDGIYAIGDVTGGRRFSYAATAMGVAAAENIMSTATPFPSHLIPRGLYTMPEAASVGLSEEEAEDRGYDVETGQFPLSINGLAMAYGEGEGSIKIVADAAYGEVLGIHIIGGRATETIWGAALALQLEATLEDLAHSIALHPTFSESLAMAAQNALGWALYVPKR
jgi:dihydrolipoamide dehydrogenase